jgi:hypothetical protein
VACKQARSRLGRSVISDVDQLCTWTLRVVEMGTGNPKIRRVRLKIQSHTQPRLELEARQGRRGGKDHDVWTGTIHIIVLRWECGTSVSVICINGH